MTVQVLRETATGKVVVGVETQAEREERIDRAADGARKRFALSSSQRANLARARRQSP